MFGMSPTKLLFTALIIVAVWYGFKWLGKYQANQKRQAKNQPAESAKANQSTAQEADYQELVRCPDCGEFYDPSDPKHQGGHNCLASHK